jgi:predicted XRE-type DNA-binding protein
MPKCSKNDETKQNKPWVESCGNVFKDIGLEEEEAANLQARTDLMLQLRTSIQELN